MTGEVPIICHKQQAFGLKIKPPNSDEARQILRHTIKNSLTILFIAVTNYKAARLVITP